MQLEENDPDSLQLMDETNEKWVKAWEKTVNPISPQ
jgi:hypothetical protein